MCSKSEAFNLTKIGELTGELPPELPLDPGEPLPTIRKRVGTEFALSEALIQRMQSSPEEELLAKLELEREIQSKITSAALKIANDSRYSIFCFESYGRYFLTHQSIN